MSHKYILGSKVKILWERTIYTAIPDYTNMGEISGYTTSTDGTPLVELYNFHKRDKYHSLYFPVHAVQLLGEVVRDGDTL